MIPIENRTSPTRFHIADLLEALDVSEVDAEGNYSGPSFFMPIDKCRHVRQYASRHGKLTGKFFTVYKTIEDGIVGFRVWRGPDRDE